MIHFFATFSDDATQSPLAVALRDSGTPFRLISRNLVMRYQHRIWLIVVGLPRLVWFGIWTAWRSLIQESPRPEAVVAVSHVQALVFLLATGALRRRTRIYLLGFIYTQRDSAWLGAVRQRYFNWLLSRLDGVIVHSALEGRRYDGLFPAAAGRFLFVPYGLHIHGYAEGHLSVPVDAGPALSAGRSGRDYATLTKAFAKSGRPLRIVCDYMRSLTGAVSAPNITLLRDCYDAEYVEELRRAAMVIVPLAVNDISAGQMVALQAMAFCKPIIATASPTLDGYLEDGVNALLVAPGDVVALQAAVDRLIADPALATGLGRRARESYVAQHSMAAFVRNIVRVVAAHGRARPS